MPPGQENKLKTLLVGLDAACWSYLQPMLDTGQLPNLQCLMRDGTWGVLESTMPPWTPTAWATLVTGKNPGKHGVFDMLWRRPGSYDFAPTSASSRLGTPFWQRLNEQGLRVGLVNVPFTYPPEPLDGFMVCGFGTPDSAAEVTYPREVLTWIEEAYGRFEPAVDAHFLMTASPAEVLDKEMRHQARQVDIAIALSRRYKVDVLVINLMLTDHANHKMPEMSQVQEAYRQADRDLGRLVDSLQPENVMAISDHGSSRIKGDFLLNAWLRDQGYYVQVAASPAEQAASINWMLGQWLRRRFGRLGPLESALRRLGRGLTLRLPQRAGEWWWRQIERSVPFARLYALHRDLPDRARTQLFPGSVYSGLLYLNVAGREPNGIIPADRRDKAAAEVAARLATVVDPDTGEPLFANVWTSEQLYTGPAAAYAPDLILDSYDSGWSIRTANLTPAPRRVRNGYFLDATEGRDFGWHSRQGMFAFAGPAFRQAAGPYGADLTDIPATLLHLCDVPVPADFDGRVLTELLRPELGRQPPRSQPGDAESAAHQPEHAFSATEAEQLVNHLRALGYLE